MRRNNSGGEWRETGSERAQTASCQRLRQIVFISNIMDLIRMIMVCYRRMGGTLTR